MPTATPESSYNLSNEEAIRRLRVKGQPIRLFGESNRERHLRLRALELIEERDQERQGGQNDFKKALEDVENAEKLMNETKNGSSSAGKRKDENEDSVDILDLDLLKTDPQKVYPIIYYALKRRLKEWEEWMDQRPGAPPGPPDLFAQNNTGSQRTSNGPPKANLPQLPNVSQQSISSLSSRCCANEWISPFVFVFTYHHLHLFQSMPDDMLPRVAEIVHHMQRRQYQRANDAYLRLSIGNAPWPIGVTMVGWVLDYSILIARSTKLSQDP